MYKKTVLIFVFRFRCRVMLRRVHGFLLRLLRLSISVRVCCCIWRMMGQGFLVRVRRLCLLRLGDLLVWLVVCRTNDIVVCLEV